MPRRAIRHVQEWAASHATELLENGRLAREGKPLNRIAPALAEEYSEARNFLYLGRGYQFPVALEGALKLEEVSYIHAEGYPAAEMKHGPIALWGADVDQPRNLAKSVTVE